MELNSVHQKKSIYQWNHRKRWFGLPSYSGLLFLLKLQLYCTTAQGYILDKVLRAAQISQASSTVNTSYNRTCDFKASLLHCHWWTGSVIITCMWERLKPGPFSSSGMRTRLVLGHACVRIISGSTHITIAHLEVWSGKAHYYLHGIRIDHRVSTFLNAKEKALCFQSPPPPPHITTVPTC